MGSFAVFCIADVPLETVNIILEVAADDDEEKYPRVLWLASDEWPSASKEENWATKTPIESVPRTYIGCDFMDVAKVLTNLPPDKDFNRKLFAVLDETTITTGDVMICHIYDEEIADSEDMAVPKGDYLRYQGDIEGYRERADQAGISLSAMSVDHPDFQSSAEDKIVLRRSGLDKA